MFFEAPKRDLKDLYDYREELGPFKQQHIVENKFLIKNMIEYYMPYPFINISV